MKNAYDPDGSFGDEKPATKATLPAPSGSAIRDCPECGRETSEPIECKVCQSERIMRAAPSMRQALLLIRDDVEKSGDAVRNGVRARLSDETIGAMLAALHEASPNEKSSYPAGRKE